MSRTVKNIIMIILLVLLIGATVFTFLHKDRVINTQANSMQQDGQQAPQAPGANGQLGPNGEQPGQLGPNGELPPEMQDGQQGQQQPPQPPQGSTEQNQQGQNTPVGPNGEQPGQLGPNGEQPGQLGPNGEQPPEMPDGQQPPQGPNGEQPPQAPGGQSQIPGMTIPGLAVPTYFYYIFAAEGLGISILLMYLIISKFNKRKARAVFGTTARKLVFVVGVVVITAGITYGATQYSLPKGEPTQPQQTSVAYSALNEVISKTPKKINAIIG